MGERYRMSDIGSGSAPIIWEDHNIQKELDGVKCNKDCQQTLGDGT